MYFDHNPLSNPASSFYLFRPLINSNLWCPYMYGADTLEHNPSVRSHTLKENWCSLPWKPSIVNSFSVKSGSSRTTFLSMIVLSGLMLCNSCADKQLPWAHKNRGPTMSIRYCFALILHLLAAGSYLAPVLQWSLSFGERIICRCPICDWLFYWHLLSSLGPTVSFCINYIYYTQRVIWWGVRVEGHKFSYELSEKCVLCSSTE